MASIRSSFSDIKVVHFVPNMARENSRSSAVGGEAEERPCWLFQVDHEEEGEN